MSSTPSGLDERIAAITPVLQDLNCDVDEFKAECQQAVGDTPSTVITAAASSLVEKSESFDKIAEERIRLANSVAEVTYNDSEIVVMADRDTDVNNLDDLAYKYNAKVLEEELPETGRAARRKAAIVSRQLYEACPAAMVASLVENGSIPITEGSNDAIREEVVAALKSNPNLLTAPISELQVPNKKVKLAKSVAGDRALRQLRRINSVAPSAEVVGALATQGITSAVDIASMSAVSFARVMSEAKVEPAMANEVHRAAVNTTMKHTNLLLSTVDIGRDTSPILDGRKTATERRRDMRRVAEQLGLSTVNLDTLFGGNDESLTEEWGTIYSPAAYFVDLLEYLKKCECLLDKEKKKGTALDYLFRKRPDLAKLDLTRENAESTLPYVDIVNEILESFIFSFSKFMSDELNFPKQAIINAHNVDTQSSSDLLWRAQNTNIDAYAYLADSIFPLTLPYHQPIDTARKYLEFLKIDRAELIDKFRSRPPKSDSVSLETMRELHEESVARLHDAESLKLTEEEYILLTKEGFRSVEYLSQVFHIDEKEARSQYGLRPVYEQYGYKSRASLVSTTGQGLQMVKGEFLRRTGITWVDLVEILQTKFINPQIPDGKDAAIMDTFTASYSYLQTLIIPGTITGDPYEFVRNELLKQGRPEDVTERDIKEWIKSKFGPLGKLVVLEYNDGPFLKLREGQSGAEPITLCAKFKPGAEQPKVHEDDILNQSALPEKVNLRPSGLLVDKNDIAFGNVTKDGQILVFSGQSKGTPLTSKFDLQIFTLEQTRGGQTVAVAEVDGSGYITIKDEKAGALSGKRIAYAPSSSNGGTADIETVTLKHLDGTPLEMDEWDKLQLFIRLWKKLGWSISEVDMGVRAAMDKLGTPVNPNDDDDSDLSKARIPPLAIRELVTIQRVANFTGLSLEKTLTLWENIPTGGNESLYHRIFLRRDTPGTSGVLRPDKRGRVLTKPKEDSIIKNALELMATMDLVLVDLEALISRGAVTDELSIENVSKIYRCKLLSQFLNVTISELLDLLDILPDALNTPATTLEFLKTVRNIQRANFSVGELAFVVNQGDSSSEVKNLLADDIKIAVTCKELRDKIAAINKNNRPVQPGQEVMAATVREKAELMFGAEKVESIMSYLEGTSVYTVNVNTTANLMLSKASGGVRAKFKYLPAKSEDPDAKKARVQSIGLLSSLEVSEIRQLIPPRSSDDVKKAWNLAIDDLTNQPELFFSRNLEGIFPKDSILLRRTASANPKTDSSGPPKSDGTSDQPKSGGEEDGKEVAVAEGNDSDLEATIEEKYTHFLNTSMPVLVSKLSQAAVVASMATVAEVSDLNLASSLLGLIKTPVSGDSQNSESALTKLTRVGTQADSSQGKRKWEGYITVPQTDDYVFYLTSQEAPDGFHIDDKRYELIEGDKAAKGTWQTDPASLIRLNSNHLYHLILYGASIDELEWQVPGDIRQAVPYTSILPDVRSYNLGSVFDQFHRSCMVAQKLELSAEDVAYINSHRKSYSGLDFNDINTKHLQAIQGFVTFRKSLTGAASTPLRNLFNWCEASSKDLSEAEKEKQSQKKEQTKPRSDARRSLDPDFLPTKIADATGWDAGQIKQILTEANFYNEDPGVFVTEKYLVQIGEMLDFARKADVDIPSLFRWAQPVNRDIVREADRAKEKKEKNRTVQNAFERQFMEYHRLAMTIRLAAQSKCGQDNCSVALRPINDKLRGNQRDAMVQYLINQEDMVALGIQDADSLFEFFLIDVQTSPLVETSRLRQAISTVQLFVQRIFLSLEGESMTRSKLDRGIWEWMKGYATWAANRKVFLYPENWLEPTLRDDKSPLFKELEAELAQSEITKDAVANVVRSYTLKLAGISNLEPESFYVEHGTDTTVISRVHFFGRTRCSPIEHYHRIFDKTSTRWTPWMKMNIEIPHYTTKDGQEGSYIIPAKLGNRLLVFMPQILTKTGPLTSSKIQVPDTGVKELDMAVAPTYYQIRMSWTEYQGAGVWMPRQIGPDSIITENAKAEIESFIFLALQNSDASPTLTIFPLKIADNALTVLATGEKTMFYFYGSELSTVPYDNKKPVFGATLTAPATTSFFGTQFGNAQYFATQGSFDDNGAISWRDPARADNKIQIDIEKSGGVGTTIVDSSTTTAVQTPLYNTQAASMVNKVMEGAHNDIRALYTHMSEIESEDFYGGSVAKCNELSLPYALYNWELGLHIPMLLVDRFLQAQQFDDALAVCHLVFDPIGDSSSTTTIDTSLEVEKRAARNAQFWRFKPFKKIQTMTLERYLLEKVGTQGDVKLEAVEEWRNSPFQPHLVARARPMAYMKWFVFKYIEILTAYGDYYFRQNTLDSLPNAIQMYIQASHLCGPRGQKVPRRNTKPMNYETLAPKLDAFANAIVRLEERHPFSNQITIPRGMSPSKGGIALDEASGEGLPSMFGFATAFYFSIPDNPKLREQRDLIDDRLFKIRNSQDINGALRKLPLFDPPLDPGMLIKAKAQGLQLSSVLSAVNGPMPNYRFQYLLGRAIDLANEVRSLGSSLLTTKEKVDGEALLALRAKHESNSFTIALDVKKTALKEAEAALNAAERNREGPKYRLEFYIKILGLQSKVPSISEDFKEENVDIKPPIAEGGLKLLPDEKLEMDKYAEAHDRSKTIGIMETLSGAFHALPIVATHGTPLGCGVAFQFGPPNIAHAMQAAASGLRLGADALTFEASSAGRKGGSTRAMYDRYMQLNQAGYDLKTADRQILVARIRVEAAKKELENHEKQIQQTLEYEDYLKSKFSNSELYSWMVSSTKTLYHDTYNHAYDLASKAVKAFKFERPRDTTDYLQTTYWDSSREGFFSGEKLSYALKQLETAYQNERGYDFEITKHVSLRQLNPLELMKLRKLKSCSFNIPEAVYDLDFPGHYLRRIKSVSISIPCVVPPYTSVSAVLRLTSHKYRHRSTAGGNASDYPEKQSGAGEDPRFATTHVPVAAIATSSGLDDNGQFELNFRDERYLPFEGAGAISSWTLELPGVEPVFSYDSISDVVMQIRYTAVDGGAALKTLATNYLSSSLQEISTGNVLVDLRNEYAGSWASVVAGSVETERVMTLPRMETSVPFYLRGKQAVATRVDILSDVQLPASELSSDPAAKSNPSSAAPVPVFQMSVLGGRVEGVPTLVGEGTKENGLPIKGTWSLKFSKGQAVVANRVWMLIQFSL
ncbi:hypothetical protein GGI35DRAFT_490758 [Trichoderma velutinum]